MSVGKGVWVKRTDVCGGELEERGRVGFEKGT